MCQVIWQTMRDRQRSSQLSARQICMCSVRVEWIVRPTDRIGSDGL